MEKASNSWAEASSLFSNHTIVTFFDFPVKTLLLNHDALKTGSVGIFGLATFE